MEAVTPSRRCYVRLATPADAAALAAFAERTFRETFSSGTSAADMDRHCAGSYSVAAQAAELADPAIRTLVAELDSGGSLGAYGQIRRGGVPPAGMGTSPVELWRFYVDRVFHGRGMASQLMARVLEEAAATGAATVWLGVWERNERARAFYRKCGFVDVGAHTFMLGRDPQTDRLMVRAVIGEFPASRIP